MENEKPDSVATNQTEIRRDSLASHAGEKKKKFVEPVISVPVDVLEATTFFQVVGTGTPP